MLYFDLVFTEISSQGPNLQYVIIGSDNNLALNRQQAIIWTNDSLVYRCIYASLCLNTKPWWCQQMETFSALLAICMGNSPVTREFPTQRPVTRSFDVFFDLHPNKRLSKQSWCWWFEMPLCPLWHHCNALWGIGYMMPCGITSPLEVKLSKVFELIGAEWCIFASISSISGW